MFKKLMTKIVGDPNEKLLNRLKPQVAAIAALEERFQQLSEEELREQTARLRERHAAGETLDDLLVEAYALVRVAAQRTTGLRPYDVQLMGGMLLHQGEVVEMRTGEGKTLVATLPLYLNALTGRGVHLVTVNDYLVRRDGGWMGKIFHALGLTVGCIGPQRFSARYDPDYVNPGAELEDERLVHWRPVTRQEAYQADITYGTSSEFGFDYLRDNMALNRADLVQRDLYFAVIDEVDNILIDEARTPLIISGPAARSGKDYQRFAQYLRGLKENTAEEDEEPNGHYDLDEKSRTISLTEMGISEVEGRVPEVDVSAGDSLYDPRFFHLTYYLDNALRAEYLFKRDVHYVVQNGEVLIVDDFTGRLMPGRRYSDGLHEAIEAKENVEVKRETVTVGTITLQNYFRLYEKLAGMTGTALTDAEEFFEIYELGVTPLPTNVEYVVKEGVMGLVQKKRSLDSAEEIYYTEPQSDQPVFFKRTDFADQVYGSSEAKDKAIVAEIKRMSQSGRPVLVGTTSVEHSEVIDQMLRKEKIAHNVLNAKRHDSEALIVAQAGRKGVVTISTNMAGRGTDILLGGNPEGLTAEVLEKEMFDRNLLTQLASQLLTEGEAPARAFAARHRKLTEDLVDALLARQAEFEQAASEIEELQVVGFLARQMQKSHNVDYNIIRQVLGLLRTNRLMDARDYLEQNNQDAIIADEALHLLQLHTRYQQARLDPQLAAQFIADLVFELNYNGRAALIRAVLAGNVEEAEALARDVPGLEPALIERIQAIRRQAEEERQEVWQLGGLHVVGSERHESRRIDNQLRGRAARQGDPGSSRFFLSIEDDLMRRFGGERLKRFMSSNVLPDDMPIEMGILDRIIENAQERIEGYNFDMRKNVVEYDDVMNKQRQAIYAERRAILLGEAVDLDDKVQQAFDGAIDDLVKNYLEDYPGFIRREIERAIDDFSTDATDSVNVNGVVNRLRGFLPGILALDRAQLAAMPARKLVDYLMVLVQDNLEDGQNLYQLLQAMNRFLPLLPAVPNVAARISTMRSGQMQVRENIRRDFVGQVQDLYDSFLAPHIEQNQREAIWRKALQGINQAFLQFNVEGLSIQAMKGQQTRFRGQVDETLRELLLESLSALDGPSLAEALDNHIRQQQDIWRKRISGEQYQSFQRALLLSAIDREWRDYLTAMDDLRREVGLEAIGQRDPKVEYKRRSFQMFSDMRHNIDEDVANRFFREIQGHQDFIRKQELAAAQQEQMSQAGYQVVQREKGRGVELRRDLPKVGRNDPCPCGSGKKYKQCHMRQDMGQTNAPAGAGAVPAGAATKQRRKRR